MLLYTEIKLLVNETKNKEDLTASIKSHRKSENAVEGIDGNTKIVEEKTKEQGSRLKHVEYFCLHYSH